MNVAPFFQIPAAGALCGALLAATATRPAEPAPAFACGQKRNAAAPVAPRCLWARLVALLLGPISGPLPPRSGASNI